MPHRVTLQGTRCLIIVKYFFCRESYLCTLVMSPVPYPIVDDSGSRHPSVTANGDNNGLNGDGSYTNGEINAEINGGINGAPNGALNGTTCTNSETPNGHHEDELTSNYEPIAIIGCGMRLPGGVNNSEALWSLLDGRHEGRCEVPHDRYNIDAFYGPGKQGHVCTKYGYEFYLTVRQLVDSEVLTGRSATFLMI